MPPCDRGAPFRAQTFSLLFAVCVVCCWLLIAVVVAVILLLLLVLHVVHVLVLARVFVLVVLVGFILSHAKLIMFLHVASSG